MNRRRLLAGVVLLLVALLSTMLVRAWILPSRQIDVTRVEIDLDPSLAVDHLALALRYETVSDQTKGPDYAEISRFHGFLRATYPLIFERLRTEIIGRGSILFHWDGEDESLDPVLLMGHLDVVPAPEATKEQWTHPPFSGAIEGGFIWGRGALDDKGATISILEAINYLLTTDHQPKRKVLIALGHDEEIGGGEGAAAIAVLLESRGLRLWSVLDEGGVIAEGLIAGLDRPVAVVGIAEKGFLTVEVVVESEGGHSSMPPRETAVGILSRAIVKLEESNFPARLTPPVVEQLRTLGPEMGLGSRLIFGNLWLLEPVAIGVLSSSPSGRAMTRTTVAPTMLEASPKENVLATRARAVVNLRLLPGDTRGSAIGRLRSIVRDPRVEIREMKGSDPPEASSSSHESFAAIQRSVGEVFDDVVVTPSLLMATTDSRYFRGLSENVYRFAPFRIGPQDLARFHGVNERVAVDQVGDAVRFYVRYIVNVAE